VAEAGKQNHEWCPHCRPGNGGCMIYQSRPPVCQGYRCLWLSRWPGFDDRWFPKACGIVVDFHNDDDAGLLMRFHVDPRTPNRWREEPYYSTIKQFALQGLRGVDGMRFQTLVTVKGERTLVFPHREMAYTPWVVMQLGENVFEFLSCKSNDAAKSISVGLDAIADAGAAAVKRFPGKGGAPAGGSCSANALSGAGRSGIRRDRGNYHQKRASWLRLLQDK
jgi:hypothetical protein